MSIHRTIVAMLLPLLWHCSGAPIDRRLPLIAAAIDDDILTEVYLDENASKLAVASLRLDDEVQNAASALTQEAEQRTLSIYFWREDGRMMLASKFQMSSNPMAVSLPKKSYVLVEVKDGEVTLQSAFLPPMTREDLEGKVLVVNLDEASSAGALLATIMARTVDGDELFLDNVVAVEPLLAAGRLVAATAKAGNTVTQNDIDMIVSSLIDANLVAVEAQLADGGVPQNLSQGVFSALDESSMSVAGDLNASQGAAADALLRLANGTSPFIRQMMLIGLKEQISQSIARELTTQEGTDIARLYFTELSKPNPVNFAELLQIALARLD